MLVTRDMSRDGRRYVPNSESGFSGSGQYGVVTIRIPERVRRSPAAAAALVRDVRTLPIAFGGRATGERLERMRRSRQFRDGAFHNPVPASGPPVGSMNDIRRDFMRNRELRRPAGPVPIVTPSAADLAAPPRDGVRLIWLGHATALVEIEGKRVLFDPIWSERCSPSSLVGPRRLHPVPIALDALPPLDVVVISHDHYDHLDMATIQSLAALQPVPFVVPLGVGAHLERWGVPPARIIELDWDESAAVAGLALTATAARHFSGRRRQDNSTLWASWVVAGHQRRVFYTGDSGYFDGYHTIGAQHGPFDATLIQIGAYSPYWPDIHMTPEEGVATHLAVRGNLLVPVHWGTFTLAMHTWAEPVERLSIEAATRGARIAVPRPGELITVDDLSDAPDTWWRAVA
jgi:L-ascorbate metabolism protein UlaG (beta-lactamase superfamily)